MEKECEWDLGKLLSVSTGYWQSCTVHAGVRLEIFTRLGTESLSAAEVSGRVHADKRGLTHLLDALVSMGLLYKDEKNLYNNTEFTEKFLDKASPQYSGFIIMHHHHLVDGWAQLEKAVIEGKPVEMRSYGEELERESFLMGMFNLAMANAPKLAEMIDLKTRSHLLDLGGGPGTYAIHFCLVNPGLQATIFDRSTTREFALQTAKRFNVQDRVNFMPGDFNIDPIEGSFDVAWLSHILHSNGPDECERLIDKTVSAMKQGGIILVHDFFLTDTMDSPMFPALFSLNMLINNEQGRSYSEKEIHNMMSHAGMRDIVRLPFEGPNNSAVLRGTVS